MTGHRGRHTLTRHPGEYPRYPLSAAHTHDPDTAPRPKAFPTTTDPPWSAAVYTRPRSNAPLRSAPGRDRNYASATFESHCADRAGPVDQASRQEPGPGPQSYPRYSPSSDEGPNQVLALGHATGAPRKPTAGPVGRIAHLIRISPRTLGPQ
jgi:hypothetical protein